MEQNDELIITTVPIVESLHETNIEIPDPVIPPIADPVHLKYHMDTPDDSDGSEKKELAPFWMNKENQYLMIHGLCDVILFYLCFRYISSMYQKTQDSIRDCKNSLEQLKEQYGLMITNEEM